MISKSKEIDLLEKYTESERDYLLTTITKKLFTAHLDNWNQKTEEQIFELGLSEDRIVNMFEYLVRMNKENTDMLWFIQVIYSSVLGIHNVNCHLLDPTFTITKWSNTSYGHNEKYQTYLLNQLLKILQNQIKAENEKLKKTTIDLFKHWLKNNKIVDAEPEYLSFCKEYNKKPNVVLFSNILLFLNKDNLALLFNSNSDLQLIITLESFLKKRCYEEDNSIAHLVFLYNKYQEILAIKIISWKKLIIVLNQMSLTISEINILYLHKEIPNSENQNY